MMRAAQDRITVMEGIREAGTVVGDGVASFLTDTTKVATTVGVITAIAAGVYGARMGASVSGKYIADKLIKVKTVHSFFPCPAQTRVWRCCRGESSGGGARSMY
jgi:ATPase family AAA domain-containing protein 3A/B